jgi:DNA gyrase subunit B
MPELVERGHIYIAQPPLFKAKHGKDERYLKDEHELKEYLLRLALEGARLVPAADQAPLSREALEELAKEQLLSDAVIARLSRRMDPVVLKALEGNLRVDLSTEATANTSAAALIAAMSAERAHVSVRYDDRTESHLLMVTRLVHGVERLTVLDRDFVDSGDYTQLTRTNTLLHGLLGNDATVGRGDHTKAVTSFRAALEWLLEQAQKGVSIQRYKGLGEMNPDQLWETTMDPASRRLLRAQIEDTIAADEIFSTLMGDVVEPRRAFIESNALGVRNLDV